MSSLSPLPAKPRPRRRAPFDFDFTEDDLVEKAIDCWLSKLNRSIKLRWWRKAELLFVCESHFPDEAKFVVGEAINYTLVQSAEQGTDDLDYFQQGQIIAAQDVEGFPQEPMYVPPQQMKGAAIRCRYGDWS